MSSTSSPSKSRKTSAMDSPAANAGGGYQSAEGSPMSAAASSPCNGDMDLTLRYELGVPTCKHGPVPPDWECMISMEDITEEDGNYCEYQTSPSGAWHPAKCEAANVQHLVDTQYQKYIDNIQKADCAAAARRLMAKGPPEWVADKHMMPVPEGDTHVCRLWYASDNKERTASLAGAVHGEARVALWAEHRTLLGALPEKEGKEGKE
jgi:hypothetical protein